MGKILISVLIFLAPALAGYALSQYMSEPAQPEAPSVIEENRREATALRESELIKMFFDYCYHHPQEYLGGIACNGLDLSDYIDPVRPTSQSARLPR